MVSQRVSEKFRRELWGFCALVGLLCVHTGIVLTVFALKGVTPHPDLLKAFGVFLIVMGVVATLASWYFHRQKREKRPMFPCCARMCQCCEADFLEMSDYDLDRSKRRRGYLGIGKSITVVDTGKQTASGFSTPEFRIYSDFLKRDSHIKTEDALPSLRGSNSDDYLKVQNKTYLHQPTNQIHPEHDKKHRYNIATVIEQAQR